jgi:hypothetical protein
VTGKADPQDLTIPRYTLPVLLDTTNDEPTPQLRPVGLKVCHVAASGDVS